MSVRFTAAFVAGVIAAGCAGTRDIPVAEPAQVATPDSVYVDVRNDHFYDARIHAVFGSGQRYTLGTVQGNGGQTERALAWHPRPLMFEISFIIGGQAYVSLPVDVVRGDIVEVRLPPNIEGSGFFQRVARN